MLIAIITVLNSLNMSIIINGKKCHIKHLTGDFCKNINIIYYSMIDCDILNINDATKLTTKKLLVLSEFRKIKNSPVNNSTDVYFMLNKYKKFKKLNDNLYTGSIFYKNKVKKNIRELMKILNNSVELNTEHISSFMLLIRFFIAVLLFTIFVNCILFFMP